MTRMLCWLALAISIGATACAGVRPPVPVVASPADREAFAGEWWGSYRSFVTGRSGSIVLTVPADSAAATGDVVAARTIRVIPRGGHPEEMPAAAAGDGAGPMAIRLVRLRGRRMQGELAPYVDPDCRCTQRTVFHGELSGDRIRGTYRGAGAPEDAVEGAFELRRGRAARKTPDGASAGEG